MNQKFANVVKGAFTVSVLAILALNNQVSFGQSGSLNWHSIPTPNAASIKQYEDIPVSYFNGLADVSVPIEEVKCSNQTIPVELSYHGGGIKADEHSSWVGLGFNLNAGGCITRNLRGGPDEYVAPGYPLLKGYYDCSVLLTTASWTDPNLLFFYKLQSGPAFVDDGQPDEFSFSFLNHSGKFFLNENREWQVVSSENLSFNVEFEMANDYVLTDVLNATKFITIKRVIKSFIITTGDGFKYYFGGNPSTIEFSRGSFVGGTDGSITNDGVYAKYVTPVSWYLTKVVAPNKEEVTFQYERGEPLFEKRKINAGSYFGNTEGGKNETAETQIITTSARNPVYLKKIVTPDKEIQFLSSTSIEARYLNFSGYESNWQTSSINQQLLQWPDFYTTREEIEHSELHLPHKYRQLDWIFVKDKAGATKKTVYFFYDDDMVTPAALARRLTLYRMQIINAPATVNHTYNFDYYETASPFEYTKSNLYSDHWGYYNGVDNSVSPYIYQFDNWRQPNATLMMNGMLKKITYPTGGNTEFIYEPHTYSKSVEIVNPGTWNISFAVNNENQDKMAGGLRIKKIISTPLYGGVPIEKEYKYDLDGINLSSGILAAKPVYQDVLRTNETSCALFCDPLHVVPSNYGGIWTFITKTDNSSYSPLTTTKGSHIVYSRVRELQQDQGYTEYLFTNYNSPDALDEPYLAKGTQLGTISSTSFGVSSKEVERGLLLSKRIFNNGNVLVQEENNEYINDKSPTTAYAREISARIQRSGDLWPCGSTVNGCIVEAGVVFAHKVYSYNKLLKKSTEITYEPTGTITKYSEFSYDQFRNKISTRTENTQGELTENYVKYNSHADYSGTATGNEAVAIKKLFTDYKINNYPVEELTILKPADPNITGQDKVIAGKLSQYDLNGNSLDAVYNLELSSPVLMTNFTGSGFQNGNLSYANSYKLQTKVNEYTSYPLNILRKPLSVTSLNVNTLYSWDYDAGYLTSITQNAMTGQAAFSSFEGSYTSSGANDDNKGNWLFPPSDIVSGGFTGLKSLNVVPGNYITSLYTLSYGKKYILEFWAYGNTPKIKLGNTVLQSSYAYSKESGDWKFYSIEVTGTGEQLGLSTTTGPIGLSTRFDEVRLFPAGAQMNSYNYDRLTSNVTSITDPSGVTTFYQYDFMGRLTTVTDEKRNILKNHNYQLQAAQ